MLAGGQGTRLAGILPRGLPKTLAPVGARPFLSYLLGYLYRRGARRVILSLGIGAEEVVGFVAGETWPRDLSISHAVEPRPLGTAGGLRNVLPLVKSDPFLAMNGDSLADVDLGRLLQRHRETGAEISVALAEVADASLYGVVELDADRRITRFAEKSAHGRGLVNVGIYAISRKVVAALPPDTEVSWERDVLARYSGRGLYGHRLSETFIDIGTPGSLAVAAQRLAAMGATP